MLDITALKIINTLHLQPGQLARLSAFDHALALFARIDWQPFVVPLEGTRAFEAISVELLEGYALLAGEVVFEVDPASLTADTVTAGALVRFGTELRLSARDPRTGSVHSLPIRADLERAAGRLAFTRWRAVIGEGERAFTLFEHDAAAQVRR